MNRLDAFTDREKQIESFENLWLQDMPWILVYSGLSGNGKSTLIDFLIEKKCKPQKIKYVKIDFDLYTGLNYEIILDELIGLFTDNIATKYKNQVSIIRESYHVDLTKYLQNKASRSIDIRMTAKENSQISQSNIQVEKDDTEEKLFSIFQDNLLRNFFEAVPNQNPHKCILFFDTFERIQDSLSQEDILSFWNLLQKMHHHNPALRVIFSGREDIANPTIQNLRIHSPLFEFSQEDMEKFITHRTKSQFPANLFSPIFNLTRGHPLLTEMAVNLWLEGEESDKSLSVEEINDGLKHRSGKEWLYERIISRLEKKHKHKLAYAIRYGPLLRQFDMRTINAILPDEIGILSYTEFEELTHYVFIKQIKKGYIFHELVQNCQRDYLTIINDPELIIFHKKAATYFQTLFTNNKDDEIERNLIFHICCFDPNKFFNTWQSTIHLAQLSGNYLWLNELVNLMLSSNQFNRLSTEKKGWALFQKGDWLRRQYKHDEALHSFKQALNLFLTIESHNGKANTLLSIGEVHRYRKEIDVALESYQLALDVFHTIKDTLGEANTLKAIGDVQRFIHKSDASLNSYQKALELFNNIENRLGQANTLLSIGDEQCFLNQLSTALTTYYLAISLFRSVGERTGEANTFLAIGNVKRMQLDNDAALTSYQQALDMFHNIGDQLGEANTLKVIGDVYGYKRNNVAAITYYQNALNIFRIVSSYVGEANTLLSIGDIQAFQNEYTVAFVNYQQAANLFRLIGDKLGEANTFMSIGDIQKYLGEYDDALVSYQQAIYQFRALGDKLGEANILKDLGDLQRLKNENNAALNFYQKAISLYHTIEHHLGEANTFMSVGILYQFQENIESALSSFQIAYDLFHAIGDQLGEANTLMYVGLINFNPCDIENSNPLLFKSLELFQLMNENTGPINIYWGIGNQLLETNKYSEAVEWISKSIDLAEKTLASHPQTHQMKRVLQRIRNKNQ